MASRLRQMVADYSGIGWTRPDPGIVPDNYPPPGLLKIAMCVFAAPARNPGRAPLPELEVSAMWRCPVRPCGMPMGAFTGAGSGAAGAELGTLVTPVSRPIGRPSDSIEVSLELAGKSSG